MLPNLILRSLSSEIQTHEPHLKHAIANFSNFLQLNIEYLLYFSLIFSTERFSRISINFWPTARLSLFEYYEESPINVFCPATFDPKVYWLHAFVVDGKIEVEEIFLLSDSKYSIRNDENSHYLLIHRADLKIAGAFTCLYEEKNYYRDYTTRIFLTKLPQFHSHNKRFYGAKQLSVTINCQVPGAMDMSLEIRWKRHYQVLKNSNKYRIWHENDNYSLEIFNLTVEDSGWYYCFLQLVPTRKKKVVLYVKSSMDTEDYFEVRSMHPGENLSISCPSDRVGHIELRKSTVSTHSKMLIKSVNTSGNGSQIFTLNNLVPTDEGMYTCHFNGSYYRTTPVLALRIIEYKPKLLTQDKHIVVYVSSMVKLKCASTFRSFQKIFWFENSSRNIIAHGEELSDFFFGRFALFVDEFKSILIIKSVMFTDENDFVCQLGEQKSQIKLEVKDIPHIYECVSYGVVPAGVETRIKCTHERSDELNITWCHNGENIDLNSEKYGTINENYLSILILRNPQVSDSGNYTGCFLTYGTECFHKNFRRHRTSHIINIVVTRDNNRLLYDNKFESLNEGGNHTIMCHVYNLLHGQQLCWVMPNGIVKQCRSGIYTEDEFTISSSIHYCNLTITHLIGEYSSRTHSGSYVCRTNCSESAQENSFIISYQLSVTSGPKFFYETKNLTAFYGYRYRIYCSVLNPDEREVLLIKHKELGVHRLKSEKMSVGENYQFFYDIPLIRKVDEGEYICQFKPSWRHNDRLKEMKIHLNIIGEPVISTTVTGDKTVGGNVNLHCNVSNMRNYTDDYVIKWWKDETNESVLISRGNELKMNAHYYSLSTTRHYSQLNIRHLFNSDYGFYTCQITTLPAFTRTQNLFFPRLDIVEKDKIFGLQGVDIELSCKFSMNKKDISWFVKIHGYTFSIEFLQNEANQNKLPVKYEIFIEEEFSRLKVIDLSETAIYRCLYPGVKLLDQLVEIVDSSIMSVNDVNVKIGGMASLTCQINVTGDEIEAVWIFNRKKLTGLNDRQTLIRVRNYLHYSMTIIISPVQRDDQGNYTCLMQRVYPQLLKTAILTVSD